MRSKGGKKAPIAAFANACGVNTLSMANFKLPVVSQPVSKMLECLTISSTQKPVTVGSRTPQKMDMLVKAKY